MYIKEDMNFELEKKKLKKATRDKLETLSLQEQKRWLACPRLESMIQRYTNNLIYQLQHQKQTVTPTITPKVPDDTIDLFDDGSGDSSGSEENMFSLFDD